MNDLICDIPILLLHVGTSEVESCYGHAVDTWRMEFVFSRQSRMVILRFSFFQDIFTRSSPVN